MFDKAGREFYRVMDKAISTTGLVILQLMSQTMEL